MPRVSIERFRQTRERLRCGLGACVDAVDLEQRGRPVVLKFLPPIVEADVEPFDAVARSLEPLRHASVVAMLGHGLDGFVPFLALEPPEGRGLTELLGDYNEGARWPDLGDVRSIVDGACAAVAVGHRMRVIADAPVVHGLLSSHSVFARRPAADAEWEVSVMDFALAALPGVAWRSSHDDLAADPRSPEQLADPAALTCATDVFALGVLAVTLLVPFPFPVKPPSWARFVERNPGDVRALLTSMRPDLPPALCDELVRALAPSPDDRHADADRLRIALRRVAWEPVREIAPPQRVSEPRAKDPHDVEASSPQLRLPSALAAEPVAPAHFLRAVGAAPAAHEEAPADDPTPAAADAFAESTVPTASAVDALRALRSIERARESPPPPPPSDATVVARAPTRDDTAPRRAPPRDEGTVVVRAPARDDATAATALPAGDLFADVAWDSPPATPPDEDATLAEGSPLGDPADRTFSEGWGADASAPAAPVEHTRIGRLPAPAEAPRPPRPATLAAAPSPLWAAVATPPPPPPPPLLAETTMEVPAPPAWTEANTAPPPVAPPPPPDARTRGLVAASVVAALLVTLALWWSLR